MKHGWLIWLIFIAVVVFNFLIGYEIATSDIPLWMKIWMLR